MRSFFRRVWLGRLRPVLSGAAATLIVLVLAWGCDTQTRVEAPPASDAAATYTGPVYLRGTVGSVASLRNFQPLPVSGLGVVVNLRGTGSSEVPAAVRQRLINDLRRRGVGSINSPLPGVSPEQLLADDNTAVVRVDGLIPPGAARGTRFDLLVTAADSQTTSLAGGDLWPLSLSVAGGDPSIDARLLAEASGPIYLDPRPGVPADDIGGFERRAVVLGGGRAVEPRRLELVLNQSSYRRARVIESRINERFPAGVEDRRRTAEAADNTTIRIHLPRRWESDPEQLLRLIEHLYLTRAAGFVPHQTRTLANVLRNRPEEAERIVFAWRSLGPNAVPGLREVYKDPGFAVRLAALEAGARLGDEQAGIELATLSTHEDPAVRVRVAGALVFLPRSLRASRTLAAMMSDPALEVRLAAYDALATVGDPRVDRVPVGDPMKFVLDRVAADDALIYATSERRPRLALFDPGLRFDEPLLARLWGNRLMLRVDEPGGPLSVFYQAPGETAGETHDLRPDLATLIFFLAHRPTRALPQPGLNLSYGEVVDVVHRLSEAGHLPARFHADPSPLALAVARAQERDRLGRPETTPLDPEADLLGPASPEQ